MQCGSQDVSVSALKRPCLSLWTNEFVLFKIKVFGIERNADSQHSGSLIFLYILPGDRDSSVGIATRYGLDGPGIESQ
jgi:hypothetical protein